MRFSHRFPDGIAPAVNHDIGQLAADYCAVIERRRLDVLEAVAADPTRAVPIALDAGVRDEHFGDDALVVWASLDIGRHLSQAALRRLIRHQLRSGYCWDAGREIVGSYGRQTWCDRTLDALFGAMFFSESYIRHTAYRLTEQARRWREAEIHFAYAIRLLEAA